MTSGPTRRRLPRDSNGAVTGEACGERDAVDWKGFDGLHDVKPAWSTCSTASRWRHKPLDNQPFARLTCTKLAAKLGTSETRTENPSVKPGRLISADAEGNVYIESGDRKKIVAETATYDAGVVDHRGPLDGGINLVTMFDDEKAAAPLGRMRWGCDGTGGATTGTRQ